MYAMDALTGKQQWGDSGIDLLAPAIASPLVVGNNVVVRMKFGLLAAYAKDTGKLSWTYRLPADSPADVTVGSPAIDGDDMYFTASDGSMYHLTAPMADIDPPTFAKILPTMAGDELSNTSTLQYVGAIVEDEGSGVKQDSVTLQLDGNDLTSKLQYNPDSGYFYAQLTPPLQVQLGLHKLIMTATDNRGNQAKLVKEFYVGNAASIERVPIAINGEYVPKQLTVRPGTIIEWVNTSGSSRTVIEDKNQFSSDAAYANGIPAGENWVWVVPGNARPGTKYFYHCRIAGEAGDGQTIGGGLAGVIEVVDARRDMPGLPKYKANALPAFPVPDFVNKK
jgi:plastocyanin